MDSEPPETFPDETLGRVARRRLKNREALIRAGAFDSLDDHRARLIASVCSSSSRTVSCDRWCRKA